jgi:hypothetical protein
MPIENASAVVEAMLREASAYSSILGGLEFYGASVEFLDLMQVCRLAGRNAPGQDRDLMYLFIERFHGKSALAKAIEIEAKSSGFSVRCLDGTIGATQKELRDLQPRTDVLTIVDGLPESAANRQTVLERFNSLAGKGLLLARVEYCNR